MKKYMVLISALTIAVGLTACSNNQEEKTGSAKTNEAVTNKVDTKKELVRFYMDLGSKINAKDVNLNAYVAKATKEDAKPEELPTAEDRAKASESAAAVAAELNGLQVPDNLKNQKAVLEQAIKDYATSYQEKAEELKKDTPSLEAGEAAFAQGEQKLEEVFKSAKLLPPSLGKQVN